MDDLQRYKAKLLSNPEVAKKYEALRPGFELAAQLIKARTDCGLSQAQLAELIGTKQSAIARMESGEYNPSINMLYKVAKATDASLEIRLKV